jgi:hypothetical protein
MKYQRILLDVIKENLFKKKVIVLYGARRTGKTTLVKTLIEQYEGQSKYINCDLQQYKDVLKNTDLVLLEDFIGNSKLVVLDEAQQIQNIGMVLKVIVDSFSDIQIIATGSSSFDLSNKVSEPLTGRSRKYLLMPISMQELNHEYDLITLKSSLPLCLTYGLYPQVLTSKGDERLEEINDISSNYLYKDLFEYENIKKPDLLFDLLKAISLQLGSECSYNELAQLTGTNVHTIKRYIELLEKSFVIFRLKSFSRNLRKEINKSQKIFFYDTGIRNSIIQNFNDLSLRSDVGGLWENFCIAERIKYNQNNRRFVNVYFWRTYDQKEIDYIEEKDGHLTCFEFKFNPAKKTKTPKDFINAYPGSSFKTITPDNFYELMG